MNRNWSNQKTYPALKTKTEIDKIQPTERAALSQKVVTQQPKPNKNYHERR